jgi:hypothetical protein
MPSQLPVPYGLTPKMLAFVDHYVELGGKSQEQAAVLAGYAASGAAALASRLLRRPDVLAYLRHVAETRIRADVVISADVLRMIRDDASVPPGERRKAASELLDRAGLIVAKLSQHNVVVDDRRRSPADMARIIVDGDRRLLDDLLGVGIIRVNDRAALDAYLAREEEGFRDAAAREISDAAYELVEDDANAETSLDGLEDLVGA